MNRPCDLSHYYRLMRDTDRLYERMQKRSGLSDGEYWCLAAICLEGCRHAHEICALLHMNRQTVSAALRNLSKKELIRLAACSENLRTKEISITAKGNDFAEHFIAPLAEIENTVWLSMPDDLRGALIHATEVFNDTFRKCLGARGYD